MAADVDIEASGLLDGLEGDARRDRAELIAWLLDRGFSLEHIRSSTAPVMLPAYRVLGDDGTLVSAREICESTGIDLTLLQRMHRAIGLPRIDDPDAAVLPRADAEAVKHAKAILDLGYDPEETVAVMRVLVLSLGQAAAMMREAALKNLLRPGYSEIDLARASEQLSEVAAPLLAPMMDDLVRMELRHTVEMEAVNAAERAAGTLPGARPVSVAFADMAGFTGLGEALPAEDLERVASRFAELAHDAAAPPVKFVKSIGDAVMFVSSDAALLVQTVLELADAAANDLPPLRIGVASGLAVTRAGDWYGSAVNLASRVTASARPGTVLLTATTRDEIGSAGDFEWFPMGARRLKGMSAEVKLYRVERATRIDSDSEG
ncbi:adenylate/guanylate cyclase domain-containing protein [Mycobacterium intermedium]|uniref:Adenylate/guanylate cyclase domain-containing protein n=1 Tax=Mycobacterium intermedium TaxID=28445 RepID=A0A1E3SAZ1_MYCIE|nr:adenylate/guanylate cyclase domain-containing protein [Mycobacterium intermedium]MCV6967451.1 adenylate/guanylate cyclase domain-containing protein [Mycobacterium intermedium]ODQ99330.1 cyclase [Mycobacterium intermedium]OPE49997.1 adenylate/guanylate cyclase domain-containing protein [Mycobacterium intermedium]ORB07788.1 adenylate/guanylate cyclase domain-containing protein [Mycobacterium intermedium]